jgi:hypothetical protein
MTYIDYRYRVEFGKDEYRAIDELCKERASSGSHPAGMRSR